MLQQLLSSYYCYFYYGACTRLVNFKKKKKSSSKYKCIKLKSKLCMCKPHINTYQDNFGFIQIPLNFQQLVSLRRILMENNKCSKVSLIQQHPLHDKLLSSKELELYEYKHFGISKRIICAANPLNLIQKSIADILIVYS